MPPRTAPPSIAWRRQFRIANCPQYEECRLSCTSYGPNTADTVRICETRIGPNYTTIDGRFQGTRTVPSRGVVELTVTGRGGVTSDASAVVLNVAAVSPQAKGFLTVWPCGTTRPNASTLNYTAGVTVANAFTVPVGTNGKVCIYAHSATDLIADVAGYQPVG